MVALPGPESKDLIGDWTDPINCGNYNTKTKKRGRRFQVSTQAWTGSGPLRPPRFHGIAPFGSTSTAPQTRLKDMPMRTALLLCCLIIFSLPPAVLASGPEPDENAGGAVSTPSASPVQASQSSITNCSRPGKCQGNGLQMRPLPRWKG